MLEKQHYSSKHFLIYKIHHLYAKDYFNLLWFISLGFEDTPKIIYASRTHSQISQAVSELKNTRYTYVVFYAAFYACQKRIKIELKLIFSGTQYSLILVLFFFYKSPKICVLGSREQMCINSEVMKEENHNGKVSYTISFINDVIITSNLYLFKNY